jgi:hypothetical protein
MEKSHGNVQPIGVATATHLAGELSGFLQPSRAESNLRLPDTTNPECRICPKQIPVPYSFSLFLKESI